MHRNLSKLWVRTWHFDCSGLGSISCWGTKIPQATWHGWKKKVWSPVASLDSLKQGPREGDWEQKDTWTGIWDQKSSSGSVTGMRHRPGLGVGWSKYLDWSEMGCEQSYDAFLFTELEPRLGQVVLCMMSWDRKSLGSCSFQQRKVWLMWECKPRQNLTVLGPVGLKLWEGRAVLFTAASSVCWHTAGA